jgi:anti-sigma regulatory factor (Ser/Thr protein kinase)
MTRFSDGDGKAPLRRDLSGTSATSLAEVRRWTTAALADLDEEVVSAAQLVLTEIVSNAYDHAGTPNVMRLWRDRRSHRICLEVDNPSPWPPVLSAQRPDAPRGRGLLLVDELADDWGSHRRPGGGKTVWATIGSTTHHQE